MFVSTGTDIQGLLQELEPLLISTDDFRLAADKKGYSTRIRAGKYAIEKGMNNNEIINTLRARSLPVKVTFNNVERIEDLAGRLAQQVEADSLTLLKQMLDPEFLTTRGLLLRRHWECISRIPISFIGMLVQQHFKSDSTNSMSIFGPRVDEIQFTKEDSP